jgi:hypothetical protein
MNVVERKYSVVPAASRRTERPPPSSCTPRIMPSTTSGTISALSAARNSSPVTCTASVNASRSGSFQRGPSAQPSATPPMPPAAIDSGSLQVLQREALKRTALRPRAGRRDRRACGFAAQPGAHALDPTQRRVAVVEQERLVDRAVGRKGLEARERLGAVEVDVGEAQRQFVGRAPEIGTGQQRDVGLVEQAARELSAGEHAARSELGPERLEVGEQVEATLGHEHVGTDRDEPPGGASAARMLECRSSARCACCRGRCTAAC